MSNAPESDAGAALARRLERRPRRLRRDLAGGRDERENVLLAHAATLEEAYRLACIQARAVGMLAPAREGPGRCGGTAQR